MLSRTFRLLRLAKQHLALLWFACRHPDTPRAVKLGAALILLYVLSPLDLIPDWLPLLGLSDDAAVVAIGVPLLLRFVPAHVLAEARAATARGLFRFRI